jgi:hypothetical protein
MKEKLELRMYGLVPYNISPIQQGIQFGHAVVEYSQRMKYLGEHGQSLNIQYNDWADEWKTFIILNGGTTNSRRFDGEYIGTLNRHEQTLRSAGLCIETFHEPDLGDSLTAIVFIVDERVFNKEKYPDYEVPFLDVEELKKLKKDGKDFKSLSSYEDWKNSFGDDSDKIVFLRDFLKQFRLA